MSNTIMLNGTEYIPVQDVTTVGVTGTDHVIVIADRGWIFIGHATDYTPGTSGPVTLTDASVVRRWTNGKGIGGLADPGHKDDYTLDAVGTLTVHAPLAIIEARW
jgi:hypothetical protein